MIPIILPGIFPLHWSRIYRSENHHVGALGQGWSLVWERSLRKEDDSIVYQNDEGREIVFPLIKRGERYFSPTEHIWLARTERDTYAISSPFETCFIFEAFSEAGVAKLASLEDLNGHALYFSYDDIGQLKKYRPPAVMGCIASMKKGVWCPLPASRAVRRAHWSATSIMNSTSWSASLTVRGKSPASLVTMAI